MTVILPKLSQTGANEWADAEDNDVALRDYINANLVSILASRLAGAIPDTKLESPNNSVYREIFRSKGFLGRDFGASTYMLGTSLGEMGGQGQESLLAATGTTYTFAGGSTRPGVEQVDMFYFDDADYAVAGKTQKLRLRAQVAANATAPAITFTFGLYALAPAGGADLITFTLGALVGSSTVAIASPSASVVTSGVNTDFTVPADGAYALGVVTSGVIANNSAVGLYAQLQHRSV